MIIGTKQKYKVEPLIWLAWMDFQGCIVFDTF